MKRFSDFLGEAQSLVECVGVTGRFGDSIIVAKNRDRAYRPDLEIIHTVKNGTEIAYLHDMTTDWSEGMNEYGIAIVNTALLVGYDEDEKKIIKKGTKPSKDGARIRYALSKKNIRDVVRVVAGYNGGVKGHTIIASPDATYTVELTSRHKPFVKKYPAGSFIVRTNHGIKYPDAGYTQADEPADWESSTTRRKTAQGLLKKAHTPNDVLPAMRTQTYERASNLNIMRDTKKMMTSSQLLMNVTELEMELDYVGNKVDHMIGITDKLPANHDRKIAIKFKKLDPDDILQS